MDSTEYEIKNPPSDGISHLSFVNEASLFVTSWDCSARIYDTEMGSLSAKLTTPTPLLAGCLNGGKALEGWVAGLSGQVFQCHFGLETMDTLAGDQDAHHRAAISSLVYDHAATRLLISGGWDSQFKVYDTRLSNPVVDSIPVPDRVYAMDLSPEGRLVVAMAQRHIHVYDMKKLAVPLQKRESSLKYQTRTIRCAPSGEGFVVSSIEGRVAVEYFDSDPIVQAKKYAFKCHRIVDSTTGTETVYPVNALAFHPLHSNVFLTGGSDGLVHAWDSLARKKIKSYPRRPTSISAVAFSPSGMLLASASSYCYEEGEKDHPLDAIYIRRLTEAELKPKSMALSSSSS